MVRLAFAHGSAADGSWHEIIARIDESRSRNEPARSLLPTYRAAIRECGKMGKWQTALGLLRQLREDGGPADPGCYAQTMAACRRGNAWRVSLALFDELDTDRSGQLNFDEFKTALRQLRIQIPEHERRMVFSELDVDRSGQLSVDEFQSAIKIIRNRYLERMLDHLNLTREAVYLTTIGTILFLPRR